MRTILINEETYKKLFENFEDEAIYNSPDKISDNDVNLNWGNKDAQPFFLMPKHKIVYGVKGRTHNDYINSIQNPRERRNFINSVLLQGRYWENANVFSFWNMSDDDTNNVKTAIKLIGDLRKPCYIYYKDKKYEVKSDENGYMWFKDVANKENNNAELDEKKMNFFNHWFESDMNFVKTQYVMTTFINGYRDYRELNDYELFAATCYQIWTDFFRNEREDVSIDDFKLFVELKTHGRQSFDSMFDYFHKNMRKKMYPKNKVETDFEWEGEINENNNLIEDFLSKNNIDDTEYEITFYDNSEKPYSYLVRIYNDKEKCVDVINNAKNDEKFVVDRINARKLHDDNILFTFRIRLNPEFDDFWKK